ncbi:hypothetical protein L7F22_006618 [Adiantum nelumboides]|nr:hypothetical protein [Adiantum nelumboides]
MAGIVREFDYFQIENDVNAALQAASDGTLVPRRVSLESMPIPSNRLTEKATRWAHDEIHPSLFAHCLRTFYFGSAIAREALPDVEWSAQTFYLAAILHDIKCSPAAFQESHVSFEFHGGMAARGFLVGAGAGAGVADTVMEAICRHKDASYTSSGFSAEGQMLRFGAQLDVLGNYAALIDPSTLADVVHSHPRQNFNNVFADTLIEEVHIKRFCTGARLLKPGQIDSIRNNPVMRAYDEW